MRIPKTIGARIDLVARLRSERLELDKKVKAHKAQEAEITDLILADLRRARLDKASGKTATFSYAKVLVPKVTDWEVFYTWIADTHNFDLLQRRVSDTSYREHLENGEEIAGVESESIIKTSLTKL